MASYSCQVDRSTHYHTWVRPSWVSEMKRNWKYGVHTFYRPRKWGDGSDAPSCGQSDGNRRDFGQALRGRRSQRVKAENRGRALVSIVTSLDIRATSKFGAEWVSAPDEM